MPRPDKAQEVTLPTTDQEIVVESPDRTSAGVAVIIKVGATTATVAVENALLPALSVHVSV